MTAIELEVYGFNVSGLRPGRYRSVLQSAADALALEYQELLESYTWDEVLGRWVGAMGLRPTPTGAGAITELVAKWDVSAAAVDTNDAAAVNRQVAAAAEIIKGSRALRGYAHEITLTGAIAEVAEQTAADVGAAVKTAFPWALAIGVFLLLYELDALPAQRRT